VSYPSKLFLKLIKGSVYNYDDDDDKGEGMVSHLFGAGCLLGVPVGGKTLRER